MIYRYLLILVAAVILSACTPVSVKRLQQNPPPELALKTVIKHVPFRLQPENHCGPATLAMSLAHYGHDADLEALAELVYVLDLQGSLQSEMTAALRRSQFLSYRLPPSLEALLLELDAGHPVIVLQNLGLKRWPQWHYALAVGYDLTTSELVLHSGENAYHRLRLKKFAYTWARSNNWAIVPLPPDKLPAQNDPDGVFLAITDLMKTLGSTPDVEKAFSSAISRWPQHDALALGLSNLYHAEKEYRSAVEVLLNALESNFNSAAIYNNLAYGLLELDCTDSARQAISCAVGIDESPNYLSSKSEIDARVSRTRQSVTCPVVRCRD